MATITIQPSNIDCSIRSTSPDTNYGSDVTLSVANNNPIARGLFKFDLSDIRPIGSTIVGATLSIYKINYSGTDGKTYWAYRLTRTNWVEDEVTWNKYSAGNNWTTAGGDYTATDGDSVVVPSPGNWMDFSVGAQIQTAVNNSSTTADFLIKDGTESGLGASTIFHTRESASPTLEPKLFLDYIAGPHTDYVWTSYKTNPTVTNWDITPEYQTIVTEVGTGKLFRNSKWTAQRRKFKVKYRIPMRDSDILAIRNFFITRKGRFYNFDLYVAPLGTTHTVIFNNDMQSFPYFMNQLANFGEVDFQEVIGE